MTEKPDVVELNPGVDLGPLAASPGPTPQQAKDAAVRAAGRARSAHWAANRRGRERTYQALLDAVGLGATEAELAAEFRVSESRVGQLLAEARRWKAQQSPSIPDTRGGAA